MAAAVTPCLFEYSITACLKRMVCVILFMANRVTPAFWFCLDNSTLTQVTPVRYFFLCFVAYHCNTYVGPRLSAFVFLKAEPFLIYNDDAEVFPQGSASFFCPLSRGRELSNGIRLCAATAAHGAQGRTQRALTGSACLSAG